MSRPHRGGVVARLAMAALAIALSGIALAIGPMPSGPPGNEPARRVALPGTAGHGEDLYASRGCAACHATTFAQEAQDGLLRAGHPLEGVAHRGTWWNGRVTGDAAEAAEICLRSFVDPNAPGFTAEEGKALVLFLKELGSERGVSPMAVVKGDPSDVNVAAGDAGRGREIWRRACLACHAEVPFDARKLVGDLSPARLAEIVRQGTRTMPFFQVDRLPSPMVADVVAYLEALRNEEIARP
ncbi:MAG: c-type cytochrome [Candidatus Polarisedimenticolia bacterium]